MPQAMYDNSLRVAAGLQPVKVKGHCAKKSNIQIHNEIKKALRVADEADAITRYKLYNCPVDMTSLEVERLLYYRYMVYMFYYEPTSEFYIMPGVMDSTGIGTGLDFNGRPRQIHPIPLVGDNESATKEERNIRSIQEALLNEYKLKVYYTPPIQELTYDEMIHAAVPLYDYSPQWVSGQYAVPRYKLQDPFIDLMSHCLPLADGALQNSTGISTIKADPDGVQEVMILNDSCRDAALNGDRFIGVTDNVGRMDVLNPPGAVQAADFLQVMQAEDNLRLQLLGRPNGGVFEKKAHMLASEQSMNAATSASAFEDGLAIRQNFADTANCIWGLGMSYEPAEGALGVDTSGDGLATDEQDQAGYPGENKEATV